MKKFNEKGNGVMDDWSETPLLQHSINHADCLNL